MEYTFEDKRRGGGGGGGEGEEIKKIRTRGEGTDLRGGGYFCWEGGQYPITCHVMSLQNRLIYYNCWLDFFSFSVVDSRRNTAKLKKLFNIKSRLIGLR